MNTEVKTTKASDTQVGGSHYKDMGQFQPWDVLAHWLTPDEYRGYQKGVAIAYLARERSKGGSQDIRKAAHHLQRLVEELEAAEAGREVEASAGGAARQDDVQKCCGNHSSCTQPCVPRMLAMADKDGWINWSGGPCPVPVGTMVEARHRNGQISAGRALETGWVTSEFWQIGIEGAREPDALDIVRFRIVTP